MRKNGISGCFSLFGFLALLLSGFTCFAILFSGVSAEAPQPLPEEARSVLPEPPETGPADTAVPGTEEVSGVSEAEETLRRDLAGYADVPPSDAGTAEADPLPAPSGNENLPEGAHPVIPSDLSCAQTPGFILSNGETDAKPDCSLLAERDFSVPLAKEVFAGESGESPVVLIVHTHGTESYLPDGRTYALDGDTFNTEDTSENVVAVGAVLAETLRAHGIPTVHCKTMHNLESYDNAYEKECETVLSCLAAYPTIRYVLDIHRDGLINADGEHIRPVFAAEGGDAAQIMFVVGTNENGANHPNWEDNLTVAAKWQKKLLAAYPASARPINLRKSSFNQQYTPASLLIEVGGNANTLDEAKRSAVLLGDTLAELIYELSEA